MPCSREDQGLQCWAHLASTSVLSPPRHYDLNFFAIHLLSNRKQPYSAPHMVIARKEQHETRKVPRAHLMYSISIQMMLMLLELPSSLCTLDP